MKSLEELPILDIFSGIGGFSKSFDEVEIENKPVFKTVAFCEWDLNAQKVLDKHWPNTFKCGDIKYLSYQDGVLRYTPPDRFERRNLKTKIKIICGGFPCQDISTAGKQKGLTDESGEATRSGLWFQYKRLIQEIKPTYVVIENVRNLLSNGFATVIKDLSEIGYDAEWEVISARDVGACHLRERVWIIAYPHGHSVRNFSKRNQIGWEHVPASGKTQPRDDGQEWLLNGSDPEWNTNFGPAADSDSSRVERLRKSSGIHSKHSDSDCPYAEIESGEIADSDDFRFWPTFTSEEAKREWWASSTSEFRDWWEAQPEICGNNDVLPDGLHSRSNRISNPQTQAEEKARQARIKQLGNSIVPAIAKLIANRIAYHEFDRSAKL